MVPGLFCPEKSMDVVMSAASLRLCEAAEAHTITALLRYYYALQLHPSERRTLPLAHQVGWCPFFDCPSLMMTRLEGGPGFSMNLCLKPVHARVIITR